VPAKALFTIIRAHVDPLLSVSQLLEFFRAKVPLATAMAVEVLEATPARVHLRFPLAPNINHHGTAFGGSLSAAGILAGWSLLHVGLSAQGVRAATVVAESRTRYLAPIAAAFDAVAQAPPRPRWEEFLDMLGRWGRAKLELRTELLPRGESRPAALHEGVYVAILQT
jgi:thioesterase domain-containing protein